MQQGKASLNYVPFHQIKRWCNDSADEACDLALDHYPPEYVQSARVGPEWLSHKQFLKILEMRSHGKNILEIAEAVGKNASILRSYMDTYLKNINTHDIGPLPSASSTESQSTADTSTGSDELFPLDNAVMVPQQGAPDPSFLSRSEQELVWKMFQQNETVAATCEKLQKGRRKISQYINAYMRPKLLKLQTEQRQAEDRQAGTSMYAAPLTNYFPTSETAPMVAAAETAPRLFQEPSLHSMNKIDLELQLIDPLLLNPTPNVLNQSPRSNGVPDPLPTSPCTRGSLFGDSPVDENHAGSPLSRLVPTHQKEELPQPISSTKRKHGEDEEAEPLRASKRPRHCSFP